MKLDYIDSLRGVAILMVILVHVSLSVHNLSYIMELLSKYGQMGVQLFFMISSVTLFLSLSRSNNKKINGKEFFIKRFFRIAPMYYFGIIFYFSLQFFKHSILLGTITLPPDYTWSNIFPNMIFMHGFYPAANNNIVPGGWSIGTEMAFYLLVPVLFLIFEKLKVKYGIKTVFIVLISMIIVIYSVEIYLLKKNYIDVSNNSFFYFNLLNQLPVFLVGIVLFYFDGKLFILNKVSLLIFILFTFLALFIWIIDIEVSYVFIPLLSAFSFIFLFFLFKKNHYLNIKSLKRIGELSFSIYIVHFIFAIEISHQIERLLNPILNPFLMLLFLFLFTTVSSYFFALVTEKFIEKPGIEMGKRVINLKKRR